MRRNLNEAVYCGGHLFWWMSMEMKRGNWQLKKMWGDTSSDVLLAVDSSCSTYGWSIIMFLWWEWGAEMRLDGVIFQCCLNSAWRVKENVQGWMGGNVIDFDVLLCVDDGFGVIWLYWWNNYIKMEYFAAVMIWTWSVPFDGISVMIWSLFGDIIMIRW